MMRILRLSTLLIILSCFSAGIVLAEPVATRLNTQSALPNPYSAAGTFIALNYHEARDDVRDYPDPYAVDSAALVAQFSWLRGNGYIPVSLQQIIVARQGGKPLPAKAVLLTFDDAYLSFYTRVYPLLREFHYPALLAVVGRWIDHPQNGPMMYGEKGSVSSASFPSWTQLREMADSGLVELASHTYDLHHGILANPQLNLQPAAITRLYDATTGAYEGDASWRERVRNDLANNINVISRETGHKPRAVVWPYGAYNKSLVAISAELGMPVTLTLDDGANTPDIALNAVRRILIEHNPTLAEFATEVRGSLNPRPIRVVQVNLDDVYDQDAAQQELNLSVLLDRIQILKPTHVYLQATSDLNGDGVADSAYFANHQLPMRADLFNRVAWQLATRVDVKVYAVMPVDDLNLTAQQVIDLYQDLARNASFDGLVFADCRQLIAAEDASMLQLTHQLASTVSAFRAPLPTVLSLNIQAENFTADKSSMQKNAKRLATLAANYEYLALTMPPNAENSLMPNQFSMGNYSLEEQAIFRKLIFMFPNTSKPPVAKTSIVENMRVLQLNGLLNFGYAPDDFLHNQPPIAQIAPAMSLREYPMPHRANSTIQDRSIK
ncbi:MAG TPA: poly-beta-1,6-N-acetyl-D-glucosamine N-deacetylase PgaB [Methyloradius sp.]